MSPLRETVSFLVTLADSYRPGAIIEAEQAIDTYLATFHGYRSRKAGMDALLDELSLTSHWARNRGGLFEQVEFHIWRRHREMARVFQ